MCVLHRKLSTYIQDIVPLFSVHVSVTLAVLTLDSETMLNEDF